MILYGSSVFFSFLSCKKDDVVTPPAQVEDARIYKHAENPLGQSVKQWAEAYSKFNLSRTCQEDTTLSASTIPGQNQQMVFLIGNIKTQGSANITIQQGQSIFVPIAVTEYPTPTCLNWTYQIEAGQDASTFLSNATSNILDGIQNQLLRLDGTEVVNVKSYRYQTPMYSLTPNQDLLHCSGCFPGGELQMMTGGYFVVIKPLSVGTHKIELYAKDAVYNLEFISTYNITVI